MPKKQYNILLPAGKGVVPLGAKVAGQGVTHPLQLAACSFQGGTPHVSQQSQGVREGSCRPVPVQQQHKLKQTPHSIHWNEHIACSQLATLQAGKDGKTVPGDA